MYSSVLVLSLLVAAGVALPGGLGGGGGGGSFGGSGGGGGGGYGGGAGGGADGLNVASPYEFNYDVAHRDTVFGHRESGDGLWTKNGEYYVNLPDGRVQRVTYRADGSGYHPTVTYTGTASFPAGNGGQSGYGSGSGGYGSH